MSEEEKAAQEVYDKLTALVQEPISAALEEPMDPSTTIALPPSPLSLSRRQGARQQTRPHPRTVTEFSGAVLEAKGARKGYQKRSPKARPTNGTRTVHLKVNPQVWKVALKLAKGNAKRIKVISLNEVIVLNNEQPMITLEHEVKRKLRK